MRVAGTLLLLLSLSASAQEIFLHSQNLESRRRAIFEDDQRVAYLYLTAPHTQRPEKEVIAYSRVPLIDKVDWAKVRATGEPPLLGRDVASESAVIANPKANEFSFKWSTDGNAVALLRNGKPIAFATMGDKLGYSKAIRTTSHLSNPWDQARYEATFK